jgi:formiminotetrahydrofolate cyclodeaminase
LLADAACRGAAYNVRINVAALDDKSLGEALVAEAKELVARTGRFAAQATAAVEAAI